MMSWHFASRKIGITPKYPTHPAVLGLGLRLGLGIRVRVRVVRKAIIMIIIMATYPLSRALKAQNININITYV